MDDNKFYAFLWTLAAIVVAGLIAGITISSLNSTRALEALIKAGADPIRARCAVYGTERDDQAVCALIVQGGK
jgi:hypothetical protein